MKGHASIQSIIGTGIAIATIVGGFFAWSFHAVQTYDAHAAEMDNRVSLIDSQEKNDKQAIINYGNKQDWQIGAIEKMAQRLQVRLDPPPINQ